MHWVDGARVSISIIQNQSLRGVVSSPSLSMCGRTFQCRPLSVEKVCSVHFLRRFLERAHQCPREALATIRWCHRHCRDMSVPLLAFALRLAHDVAHQRPFTPCVK